MTVAREKQITRAAQKLHVAQPPMSYQLKQLEEELQAKLFIRNAHGIELTDAGRELASYAERILTLADTAQSQVSKTAKGELGTIRIGTASSSGACLPTSALREFVNFYPDINFDIFESNTFGIIEKLNDQTLDLGLVRTPFDHTGFEAKTLTTEPMVAVTTNQQLLRNKSLRLKTIAKENLIIYRRFENIFESSFAHAGLKVFYAVKCDDSRTAIQWAKMGMGTALVPQTIAELYAPNYWVKINHQSWETHLELIWLKHKAKPLIQRLIKLM